MSKNWIIRVAKDKADNPYLLLKEKKDDRFQIYKISSVPSLISELLEI